MGTPCIEPCAASSLLRFEAPDLKRVERMLSQRDWRRCGGHPITVSASMKPLNTLQIRYGIQTKRKPGRVSVGGEDAICTVVTLESFGPSHVSSPQPMRRIVSVEVL